MQEIAEKIKKFLWGIPKNFDWMNEDYLILEECDNPKCQKLVYSTCNIFCSRCNISNENAHGTIYHCLNCIGEETKYLDNNGKWNFGFDLCEKCYTENPNFEINHHDKNHILKKVDRQEMIHDCCSCFNYFCQNCLVTSSSPILVHEWGINDESEVVCRSICKECFEKFL